MNKAKQELIGHINYIRSFLIILINFDIIAHFVIIFSDGSTHSQRMKRTGQQHISNMNVWRDNDYYVIISYLAFLIFHFSTQYYFKLVFIKVLLVQL